ncbi:phage tail assembly chaperone [Niallia circulans]|uniref:phage tail assembly chaperone n=1 Tax=Niallia circulans TaxID=1397 RepID=UPI002E213ECF
MLSDGWRYLQLLPEQVYDLTPKEFRLLLGAQMERKYDEYERQSHFAIMNLKAQNAKKSIKATDLFKRPADEKAEAELQEGIEKAKHASEWLSQFEQFSGKEEANGRP